MSRQPEEPIFNRIEELRIEKGLSRQQLADAVGVHYQTVGYLERGEYNPTRIPSSDGFALNAIAGYLWS